MLQLTNMKKKILLETRESSENSILLRLEAKGLNDFHRMLTQVHVCLKGRIILLCSSQSLFLLSGPPSAQYQFCILQYTHARFLVGKEKQLCFVYTCTHHTCKYMQSLDLLTNNHWKVGDSNILFHVSSLFLALQEESSFYIMCFRTSLILGTKYGPSASMAE